MTMRDAIMSARINWIVKNYGGSTSVQGEFGEIRRWHPPKGNMLCGKTTINMTSNSTFFYPQVHGALLAYASVIQKECEKAVPDTELTRLRLRRENLIYALKEVEQEIKGIEGV